jgi:hypothetical protein
MHPITVKLSASLDLLYGLYLLALDHVATADADDDEGLTGLLNARDSLIARTTTSAAEAQKHFSVFDHETRVPAAERALIEEKRRMIQDVTAKLQRADHQLLRAMHNRMGVLRKELAGQQERKQAIKAYITAPVAG